MSKKSNVQKGNDFDKEVGKIITKLLNEGEIVTNKALCKIIEKPKYYNSLRTCPKSFS